MTDMIETFEELEATPQFAVVILPSGQWAMHVGPKDWRLFGTAWKYIPDEQWLPARLIDPQQKEGNPMYEPLRLSDVPPQPGREGYVILKTPKPDEYVLLRDCPLCGLASKVTVPAQGLWDWEHGAAVQTAFPTLSADEREQVLNGSHGDCFDKAFPEEDEDDDEETQD